MWSNYLALVCAAGLLAIWTLPGTIALRHLFMVLGFIASFHILRQNYSRLSQKSAWPIGLLALFYAWLLIHLAFFSQEFSAQLSELRSVWARSLVSSLIGLSVGLMLSANNHLFSTQSQSQSKSDASFISYSTLILFVGLSAPSSIIFGSYLVAMLQSGQGMLFDIYQFLYSLYRTKPAYVIFVTLSLPLCFILLLRAINHQESRWWIVLSLATILLTPFGGFFIGSKNAMIIFVLTAFLFLISVSYSFVLSFNSLSKISSSLHSIRSLLVFLLIGIVAVYSFQKHLERTSSWLVLSDNIQVGMDIDRHDFWKNREVFPRPVNASGQLVDISTYERTAWFTAGLRLLKENPLGYGLTHHSFGVLALAKWPDFYKPRGNLKGSTHSGWLDLALGVGIPGVVVIFLCLLASWIRCFKYNGLWFTYAAWTIPLILFTYLIAELGQRHFLEILFFMMAFFCGLTTPPRINSNPTDG
jgi:hypothetical protein